MESWQKKLLEYASRLEQKADQQKFRLKQKLNQIEPVTIQPYTGFGGDNHMYLYGRVLEKGGLELPDKNASVWTNVHSIFHRFVSSEIPGARVEYTLPNHQDTVQCNHEGFFEIHLRDGQVTFDGQQKWHKVQLSLQEQYNSGQGKVRVEGDIMVRQASNRLGIISDVDDTIIVTKAIDFMEKLRILLLRNAHTRKPFEGVAAFYRALEAGKSKDCQNPVFYISNASWNLYDLFDRFCEINNIPKGTFLLQDLGLSKNKLLKNSSFKHKTERICQILDTYNDLPFVLIGDSGQEDPEIYQQIAQKYPGRISAIYIRDVLPEISDERDKEVRKIAAELSKQGIDMILVQDSMEAARHAVQLNLICEEALKDIEHETYEDKKLPSDISQLLGLDKLL